MVEVEHPAATMAGARRGVSRESDATAKTLNGVRPLPAPLAPDLVRHLTREVGASGERVRGEVRALAARVTA
jgi:hypothetical protein